MSKRLEHARHLIAIDRPAEACEVLVALLAEQPEHAEALALLALATIEDGDAKTGFAHAEQAVASDPERLLGWLALATAAMQLRQWRRASAAADTAIALRPDLPHGHERKAAILASRGRWREALAAADAGLECDPEHGDCTNLRALALRQLGQHNAAETAGRDLLRRDPDDPYAHANQGWTALHRGRYREARTHFREALRIDPNLAPARHGMREALLASHWFYRPVLRYFLRMERLDPRLQFAILIGAWILFRVAWRQSEKVDAWQPLWTGIVVVYLVFVASTWLARPLAASFLLLTADGRRVLTGHEKACALAVAALVVAALLAVGWHFLADGVGSLVAAVLGGIAVVVSVLFGLEARRARRVMLGYVAVCACLGAGLVWAVARAHDDDVERRAFVERAIALEERRAAMRERIEAAPEGEPPEGVAELVRDIRAFEAEVERTYPDGLPDGESGPPTWLGLAFGVLCFWLSQFLAAGLAREDE